MMGLVHAFLAAIPAGKGDHEGNARAHVAVLEAAAEAGCDLAVFPEFSLTGSIDPRLLPAAAVPVASQVVAEVVAATARIGVGAIFGIAELASDRFYITQLYAHGGSLHGLYRKRHLGEGEEGFTPGDAGQAGGIFRLGAARFGMVICAEGGVDFPWIEARDGGARLVFFCSAPGLYGRRTDQESWRQGLSWWEESGLGDAIRHARQQGLWVAMVGQSGSNVDEDFPGLAALVDPEGTIVARLPDWRPGSLVADIPINLAVQPVREAVRTLLVDDADRALLVRFQDEVTGLSWWCPPGGGLERGEDHLDAARRELAEETGRTDVALGAFIGTRTHTFCFNGVWTTQRERWLVCRVPAFTVSADRLALLATESVREVRWWTAAELMASEAVTAPRRLPSLIAETASGVAVDPERDLGR